MSDYSKQILSYSKFKTLSTMSTLRLKENKDDLFKFIIQKNMALSPIDISDEIEDSSSSSSFSLPSNSNSPRCKRINSNVFIMTTENEGGVNLEDAVNYLTKSRFSIILDETS